MLRLGVKASEIAIQTGYESVSAFSKAIKKEYRKSPAELSKVFFPDSIIASDKVSRNF